MARVEELYINADVIHKGKCKVCMVTKQINRALNHRRTWVLIDLLLIFITVIGLYIIGILIIQHGLKARNYHVFN